MVTFTSPPSSNRECGFPAHGFPNYEPLRLPMQPNTISLPYVYRLVFPKHHCSGSPAPDRLSAIACHPCYPGRQPELLLLSKSVLSGLPHLTSGSAYSIQATRLHIGSLSLRPAILPCGNLRPLITQTPLPRATEVHRQFSRRDFNPQDKRLLRHTVKA